MFTDEHAPDYSFLPRFDVYLDDFLEIESDANNFDDDSFDSKGEKIKESELLIDQLDLPCDVPNSMQLLPFSSENEEKVFKPGIYTSKKVHFCFLPELSHPGKRISKKDKIESKPNKNEKRSEAGKSQKQLQ
nr:hypothetical protein [Tanacetum cinerariifolium]